MVEEDEDSINDYHTHHNNIKETSLKQKFFQKM